MHDPPSIGGDSGALEMAVSFTGWAASSRSGISPEIAVSFGSSKLYMEQGTTVDDDVGIGNLVARAMAPPRLRSGNAS